MTVASHRHASGPAAGRRLRYRDAIDLPPLDLAAALAGTTTGVHVPTPGERSFTRLGPAFVDNPMGVPGFEGLCDAPVRYPPVFLASAVDAELVGYRTVVAGDVLFNDDAPGPGPGRDAFLLGLGQGGKPFPNEETGLVADATGGLLLPDDDRPLRRLEPGTVSLCSHEPANWGSFLFRVLPKLRTVRDLGIGDRPMLAYPAAQAATELLVMAGADPARLVRHDPRARWRTEHLLVPSIRGNQALLDPETLEVVAELRERYGRPRDPARRLYVSRRAFAGQPARRTMTNEGDVESRLAALGFAIVQPERHPMGEQVAMFSAASVVVGPSGSGLFGAMFCRPGTKLLDIESEPHWLHAHMCLFGSAGLDYGIAVGRPDPDDPAPVHKRWTADADAVAARARRMVAGT